jgi:hypothetical protein
MLALEFAPAEVDAAIARLDFDEPLFVDDAPLSEWWEITHAASDASHEDTKAVVGDAVKILDNVSGVELKAYIEADDISGATRLFDWRGFEDALTAGFTRVFTTIAARSGGDTALEIGKGIDFDEEAIEEFIARGARIVAKRITANTRKAVVVALRRLLRLGFSPFQVRTQLLSLLGIDAQAMNAAINAIAAAQEAGASITSIKETVDELGEEKLEQRLERIARFENLNVAQAAQEEAVTQHVEVHALKNVVRVWVVTPDERLCPLCDRLRAQRVLKDEFFVDPLSGAEFIGPPAHHQCRCGLRYLQARRAAKVGVFVVDIRTPEGEQIVLPSGVKVSHEFKFHLAGKHEQKAHGRGGKKGKGASYLNDEESLSIAAFDGRLDVGNTAEQRKKREGYMRNQEAAMGHLMRDNQWGDPADIRERDSDFFEESKFSSVDPTEMKKGAHVRKHRELQKAANSERIAARMDKDLADVSTDDLRDARDSANQRFGIMEGKNFSRAEMGPDGKPTGKFEISKADWETGELKTVTVDEREAIVNDIANGYVGSWAKTADNGFPPSTAIQDSVNTRLVRPNAEFGEASTSYLRSKGLGGSPVTRTEGAKDFRNLAGGVTGKTVDSFVDSTYAETQAALKKGGIESLVLHRGTGRADVSLHEKTMYKMSPVSSWSRSKDIADGFGGGKGIIVTSVIDAKKIWSTAATGAGCYLEEEFIVLGGTQEGYASGGTGPL